ncbi:type I toxin-antitoxin system Ibs family toxin [Escherichia coli]
MMKILIIVVLLVVSYQAY